MRGTVCLAGMVGLVVFLAIGRGDLAFISAFVAMAAAWPNPRR